MIETKIQLIKEALQFYIDNGPDDKAAAKTRAAELIQTIDECGDAECFLCGEVF